MSPRPRLARRVRARTSTAERTPQRGQTIVLFALSMMTILAMAGLLVDGGSAWVSRRQAQAAADTAALAAAQAATQGTDVTTAARTIAAANGFANAYTDCGGTAKTDGVVVNQPPATGPHAGDANFIEVITNRPMKTAFAGAVGQACWMVSARAVSSVKTQVALCTFCALSDWNDYYTLDLDNGNDLRVDGDIYVNQDNWTAGTDAVNRCAGTNPCTGAACASWNGMPSDQRVLMCGTAMYVDHTGGATPSVLSAKTISVHGGWQARTHNDSVAADGLAANCSWHPTYTGWATPANVCIGVPQIVDPLNDPSKPLNIIPAPDPNTLSTCPGATYPCGPVASASCYALPGTVLKLPPGTFQSPAKLSLTGVTAGGPNYTICPGLYFGGFSEFGDGHQPKVTMLPGIYFMVGGGFSVTGTATIDGSAGVMIYNSGGPEAFSSNSVSDPTLIPATCIPPAPVGSTCKLTGGTNLVTGNGVQVGVNASYVLTVKPGAALPKPTGTASAFKFYDGQTLIACSGGITISGTTNLVATCITSYTLFGTRGITAVYLGDSVYAPAGDTATQTINPPATASSGNINIVTDTLPCSIAPCGQVVLHAQTTGQYSGLLIFQDRTDGLGIRIAPALGAAACPANYMTDGVPPNTNPVPAPCGALGGLSGTIYANHQSTGASDWDSVVNIEVSGLANVQIIASEIHVTVVNTQARFAFNANSFANGKIHLVE